MERETLKSRLGFILLSAGCAIGIGNVWKFPYIAGQGGGGAFVLFYLIFLVILGLPIMTMEFAVGRASRKSPVRAYQVLMKRLFTARMTMMRSRAIIMPLVTRSRPLCSPLAHTRMLTTTTNTIQKVIVAGLASISVNLPATCSAFSPASLPAAVM